MSSSIQPDGHESNNVSNSLIDEFRLLEESRRRQIQVTDASLKAWIMLKFQEFFQNIGQIVSYPNRLLDSTADEILAALRNEQKIE